MKYYMFKFKNAIYITTPRSHQAFITAKHCSS